MFSVQDYGRIKLVKNWLYLHGSVQIRYTVYNFTRSHNTIKPFLWISGQHMHVLPNNAENCFVMLASSINNREGGKNPFWYTQVLLIMHVNARYVTNSIPKCYNICWVQWLGPKAGYESRPSVKWLDKVGFVEDTNPATFGLTNPADIVHAVHLIPLFQDSKRNDILSGPLVAQSSSSDWLWYYISR